MLDSKMLGDGLRSPLRAALALSCMVFTLASCARERAPKLQDTKDTTRSGSFRLLTYNVAGLPQIVSRVTPARNIPLISPLLNAYDLALVQEDFFYQRELRAKTFHPFKSNPLTVDIAEGLGDGLNQFSRSPFHGFERVTWQRCHGRLEAGSDCLTDKGFTRATHELADGVRVDVYNLHMDAGGYRGDEEARAAQAKQLCQTIEHQSAGRAVIVAGDTNVRPSTHPTLVRLLAEAKLVDACAELHCPERERIDRVLYRSSREVELKVVEFEIAREFVDRAGRALSDHDAIAVRFSWARPPPPPPE